MRTCETCGRTLPADRFPRVGRPSWGQSQRWCDDCWLRKVTAKSPQPCRVGHPRAARATNGRRSWCWACGIERELAA